MKLPHLAAAAGVVLLLVAPFPLAVLVITLVVIGAVGVKLVQRSNRLDRARARAGLQPFDRYCDEPVRYRVHPDDRR